MTAVLCKFVKRIVVYIYIFVSCLCTSIQVAISEKPLMVLLRTEFFQKLTAPSSESIHLEMSVQCH